MKQYLIFYHYIYIKCSSNQTLLYNLLDGKYIVVNDPVLVSCISKVHEKSYYGFEVTDEISKLQSFVPFVHEVENLMFGEIFKDLENRLPLVFHPVVDVKGFSLEDRKINSVKNGMRSVKYFRNRMGSEIVENLFDITIYVTSSSKISEYKFAYKQYHFPFYSKSLQIVNLDWLEKELRFSYPNLKSINVILGDIDERYLSELLDLILKFSLYNNSKVYLYLLAEQFYQYKKDLLQMSNIQYVLWIRNISEMQEHSSFKNVVYSVLAKNRVEYQGYRRFFKHSKVPIVIYPYFDKGNKVFCEEELSYTIPELLSIPLKHNMVIANSILNTNTFGSLYILPNGSVYSDINCEKLAVLNDTITIKEILFIELTKKRNWYLTRNEVEPCNDCIFVNICPSITNIEHFMGKYDFCKIERGEA